MLAHSQLTGESPSVSKRRRLAIYMPLVVLFGGVLWYALQPGEPVYGGKPLTLWLKDLSSPNEQGASETERALSRAKVEKARNAVQQIGTNAIPHLIRMVRSCRPDSRLRRYADDMLERQRLIRVELPVHEDQSWLASFGFEVLGRAGEPAIPELCRLLGNPYTAVQAANCLREIGPTAVPALAGVLKAGNPGASTEALLLLGDYGAGSGNTVPLLEELAVNPTNAVTGKALRVLSRIDEAPARFIPLFVGRLQATNFAADAAFALANLRWDGALPLMDAVTNADLRIRAAALSGLLFTFRGLGTNRLPTKSGFANENVRFDRYFGLIQSQLKTRPFAPQLTPVLRDALSCTNSRVRLKAVHLLADSGVLAMPSLCRAASDPNKEVSEAVRAAVARLGVEVRD